MSTCNPQARSRLRRVGQVLERYDGVAGHTLRSPEVGECDEWLLDVTLRGGGVPSAVLTVLGRYGCELGESEPDGEFWKFVVTVE